MDAEDAHTHAAQAGEAPMPDLGGVDHLSYEELKAEIDRLSEEEARVSHHRRVLHGRIDILRAEMVNRLRRQHESAAEDR